MSKIQEHLTKAVRSAATFNPEVRSAPACILWPDSDRQWEAIIPILQKELPELLVLGDYYPEHKTGPAIWLRCAIAEKIKDISLPDNYAPVLYLPGYSRQDIRPVGSCPEPLKPLVELQYRGQIWSQMNNKDWTVFSFLQSNQGGLGLDIAHDNDSKAAMQLALPYFLDEDLDLLQGKRLDKDYFNTLLSGDPNRELLKWLDQGEGFQKNLEENKWKAFIGICKSTFGFNPETDGVLTGAGLLADHRGPWQVLWERFCESPNRYPNIPSQIRKCRHDTLLWNGDEGNFDGWPQWNDEQENALRQSLVSLSKTTPHEARDKILKLEELHKRRRSLVWAELAESPLAMTLEHLAVMALHTKKSLNAGTVDDLANGYADYGWKVDDSVLKSLENIKNNDDFNAVSTAIRSIYVPWIEDSARHLQNIVTGTCQTVKIPAYQDGDCILFVDGLRFDTAKRLIQKLKDSNLELTEESAWAALPSVTATGKAAVSPVAEKISGQDGNVDFAPVITNTGQRADSNHIKKMMTEAGWLVLDKSANRGGHNSGIGKAWCEVGDIDKEGHERGWKLAQHIDSLLADVKDRIVSLLNGGWMRVFIVTDHGWLLLPGGLPKIELHKALTENKWGRCAVLKNGVTTEEKRYPWYWNPNHYFVLADGISCFINGKEYTHGGLSLQECLTLKITVQKALAQENKNVIEIAKVNWKGLRCVVIVNGNYSALTLDIRRQAGNASSSIVKQTNQFRDDGTASVVVLDDSLEGESATIVLLNQDGTLAAQINTIIGGE